jgi:hypothetical protein
MMRRLLAALNRVFINTLLSPVAWVVPTDLIYVWPRDDQQR